MNKYKEIFLVLIISLILSFTLYGNIIKGEFIQDDQPKIQHSQNIRDFSQLFGLFISPYDFQQPEIGLYRPLPLASYMLNFVTGDSPVSFHIINIILYTLTVSTIFAVIKQLTSSKKLATITSLLFLLHPIHTEALTPIVGRAEILAMLFSLATIYLFFKKHLLWSAFSFLLAIFSKETAFMVIPIIFYVEWRKENRFPEQKRYLLFLLPAGLYLLLRFIALGKYIFYPIATTIVENPLAFVSFPERIFTALKVLYLYFEKLIFPIQLSTDYSYNVIKMVSDPFSSYQSLLGIIIFIGLVILMLHPKTRHTPLGLGSVIFFFPYLLISNLVLIIGTIMGERLIFFSSLGFCLMLAFALYRLSLLSKTWKKITYALLVIILIFYGLKTITRNEDLLSNDALYEANLTQHPDAFITRLYWSSRYMQLGKWEDAKRELTAAYNIYSNNASLQNSFGVYEEAMGDYQKAEEYYKKAISLNDKPIESYFQLGTFYLNQQNYSLAETYLSKAIELYQSPQFFTYYLQTSIFLNKPQLTVDIIHKYYGYNPKNPEIVYDLAVAYYNNGDIKNAFKHLKEAKSLGVTTDTIDIMIKNIENKIL